MRFTKTQLQQIARLVVQRRARVPFNAGWQKTYRQLAIGEPDGAGRYLRFSPQDRQLLRDMVALETGLDVLALDFELERIAMSTRSVKEKYANIRPEANYVLVKIPALIAASGEGRQAALMSEQTGLRLHVGQLLDYCRSQGIAHLMVVENLDVFDAVLQGQFSPTLRRELGAGILVYRGGGAHSAAGVKTLLRRIQADGVLSAQICISAFVDLDPAGLQIACLLAGCTRLILPQWAVTEPARLLRLQQLTDRDDFDRQHRQVAFLSQAPLARWTPLFNWMRRQRISIKQQHMLSKALALIALERFD